MGRFLEKWNQNKIRSSYDILVHNKINNMHLENKRFSSHAILNVYRLFFFSH